MYIYQAIDMNQSMVGMDFGRDVAYCNQVWICILAFCYFTVHMQQRLIDSHPLKAAKRTYLFLEFLAGTLVWRLPSNEIWREVFLTNLGRAYLPLENGRETKTKIVFHLQNMQWNKVEFISPFHMTWFFRFFLHDLWKESMRPRMILVFLPHKGWYKIMQCGTNLRTCVLRCVSFYLPNPYLQQGKLPIC